MRHASLEEIESAYAGLSEGERVELLQELLTAFPHGWDAVALVVDCFVMGHQVSAIGNEDEPLPKDWERFASGSTLDNFLAQLLPFACVGVTVTNSLQAVS